MYSLERFLQQSSQPVSPTNAEVTRWGESGIEAGLKDYEYQTKQKPGPKTDVYIAVIAFAYFVYAPYGNSPTFCSLSLPSVTLSNLKIQ